MRKHKPIFALYHGDVNICEGTIVEIAQRMGISPNNETETVINFGLNLLAEPSIIYCFNISSVMVSFVFPYFSTILFIASFK